MQLIETPHGLLRLEPLTLQDKERVFQLTSAPEVARYMRFDTHERVEQAEELIAEYTAHGSKAFGVSMAETGAFVGVWALKADMEHTGEYSLSTFSGKEYWNQGYNTYILAYLKEYTAETLYAKALSAYIIEENIGSRKIVEKNGFQLAERRQFPDACLLVYRLQLV